MSVVLLAEGEKKDNFLLPNGTFFVELIIFLVVLAVIWKFVVPPIQAALAAREAQLTKTAEDSLKAAKATREAERKYAEELSNARAEATAIRNQARAEGQSVVAAARSAAQAEADQAQAAAASQLDAQAQGIGAELKGSAGPLSAELADKVLGVTGASAASGLDASVSAGRS